MLKTKQTRGIRLGDLLHSNSNIMQTCLEQDGDLGNPCIKVFSFEMQLEDTA